MRPACMFAQRALARLAARGAGSCPQGWLALHLHACADCRRAESELELVCRSLPRVVPPTFPPPDFEAAVLRRIPSDPRRHRAPAVVLLAAALAAVAGVALLMRAPLRSRQEPLQHEMVAANPGGVRPGTATRAGSHAVPGTGLQSRGIPSAVPPVRRIGGSPRGRWRSLRLPERPRPPRPAGPNEWAVYGALSEQSGDYRLAAAAYRRAYEERGHPSLAFAAGRAAETAGDTAEAVGYYARLLDLQASGPSLERFEPPR